MKSRIPLVLLLVAAGAAPARAGVGDDSHLGFVGIELATASAPADTIIYDAGLAFGWYSPLFDVAASIGGASAPLASGDRTAFDFVPSAGYHLGWNKRDESIIQIYGSLRLPLQRRSGADLAVETGMAVAGEAGARLWGCSTHDRHLRGWCAGFSFGLRYQWHVSDFQLGSAVLPSGSSVLSFPVAFNIAFNPDITRY